MKMLIAALTLLCLPAVPAMAGNVYDNGPVNGQVDAWTINFGFAVTDSFTVSNNNGHIGGMDFWAWLAPGDSITSVEVQITVEPFGNPLFDSTVSLTQSSCFLNNFDYDVCLETGTFNGPDLANGNYWVLLQNASVPSGNPAYWDENAGVGCQSPGCPSLAKPNLLGTIPSEAFTLTGASNTGTTPEPGSLLLLASGVIGIGGILRSRKLNQVRVRRLKEDL